MATITREQALSAKLPTMVVQAWGGEVVVHKLNHEEKESFNDLAFRADKEMSEADLQRLLVVRCARDEQGNRIFSDEDMAQLASVDGEAIYEIAKVASQLNIYTDKKLEADVKNS